MNHIQALQVRLSNERARLQLAKTEKERALRAVWVAQIEKEISGEQAFMDKNIEAMTADELAEELFE